MKLEGEILRDEALERVTRPNWMGVAINMVNELEEGWTGIGEELKIELLDLGLSPPHHHNAWGALSATAVRRGLVEWTGEWRKMVSSKSHARKSPVMRRTAYILPFRYG